MTILFYYEHVITPTCGGTERVTYILAHELERRGYRCMYVSWVRNNSKIGDQTLPNFVLPNDQTLNNRENEIFLHDLIKKERVDVIINQGAMSAEAEFISKRYFPEVYIISCIHYSLFGALSHMEDILKTGYITRKYGLLGYYFRLLLLPYYKHRNKVLVVSHYKELLKYSDKVVLLSEYDKQDYPVEGKGKLSVITNPMTLSGCKQIPKKEKRILWVGRMTYQKRLDYLLRVWKLIQNKYAEWSLELLGEGDSLVYYKQLAEHWQLKNVFFRGRVDPIPYYKNSSLFCFTSAHEGFGLVLTEAMAYGCVPIAFDSFASVKDIISEGSTGFLIRPFDVKQYAQKLEELIENETLRKQMAERGMKSLHRFSLEYIADRWEVLLQQVNSEAVRV